MTELGLKKEGWKRWKDAEQKFDSALPKEFLIDGSSELLNCGYTMLSGFVDPMFSPELIQKAAGMRRGLLGMETNGLWESLFSKVPGEGALGEEG